MNSGRNKLRNPLVFDPLIGAAIGVAVGAGIGVALGAGINQARKQ